MNRFIGHDATAEADRRRAKEGDARLDKAMSNLADAIGKAVIQRDMASRHLRSALAMPDRDGADSAVAWAYVRAALDALEPPQESKP